MDEALRGLRPKHVGQTWTRSAVLAAALPMLPCAGTARLVAPPMLGDPIRVAPRRDRAHAERGLAPPAASHRPAFNNDVTTWLVRRHHVRPILAAAVAELAGLGDARHRCTAPTGSPFCRTKGGLPATKTIGVGPDDHPVIVAGYGNAKWYAVRQELVDGLTSLATVLAGVRSDEFVIRGEPEPWTDWRHTVRRLHRDPETCAPATFHEEPRRWVLFDVDRLLAPRGLNPLDRGRRPRSRAPRYRPNSTRGLLVAADQRRRHQVRPEPPARLLARPAGWPGLP